MKLKEIFDQLTFGELSQISIGGGEAGAIRPQDYARMVAHVNLGLTTLYKRFKLKEGRFILQLQPGVYTYQLNSQFAASNTKSRAPVKYINDAAFPFKDDLLKVEHIYSSSGFEFNVNNAADKLSMNTPTQRTLVVPKDIVDKLDTLTEDLKTSTLEIVYRANHAKLGYEDVEPEDIELELPETHVDALLLFVAARVHTPSGIGEAESTGNTYFQKYEFACQQLENQDFQIDHGTQYNKLERNGWV
jgi:hypothetical protein